MIHFVMLQYVVGLVTRVKDHLAGDGGLHAATPGFLIADAGAAAFLAAVVALAAITYRAVERPGRSAFYQLAQCVERPAPPVIADAIKSRQSDRTSAA
jgi:peptidoglycan/LPS O-acetylase OafA/YrhL